MSSKGTQLLGMLGWLLVVLHVSNQPLLHMATVGHGRASGDAPLGTRNVCVGICCNHSKPNLGANVRCFARMRAGESWSALPPGRLPSRKSSQQNTAPPCAWTQSAGSWAEVGTLPKAAICVQRFPDPERTEGQNCRAIILMLKSSLDSRQTYAKLNPEAEKLEARSCAPTMTKCF